MCHDIKHGMISRLKRPIAFLRKIKIQKRMMLFFLLVSILPLCIVAAYSFFSSYVDIKEKIGFYSYQITGQAAGYIDLILNNIEDISDRIVNSDVVQSDFRNAYELDELERFKIDDELIHSLPGYMNQKFPLDGISLLNSNGFYRIHVGNKLVSSSKYGSSSLYRNTLLHNEKPLWTAPYLKEIPSTSVSAPKSLVVYSKNIKGRWDGNIIGVLAISINPQAFSQVFESLEFWQGGTIGIINAEGGYIYCNDESLMGERIKDDQLIQQINTFTQEESNQYFDYNLNNTKTLISCKKLQNTDWTVISMIPYSNLMSKTNNILVFTLVIIFLFILISIYVSWIVSNSISYPLNKLMSAVKKVEKGNFDIQVDESGEDEMTYLNVRYKQAIDEMDHLINELYKSRIAQQETQIKALKAQINPHFLYNTLETINSIAKIKKVDEITKIVQGLSSMFRYSMKSGVEMVTLGDEIENVRNYLSIMKVRFDDKLDFKISVDPSLYGYKMYKLILQPIVENAIHHGIEMKKGKGTIRIQAVLEKNDLFITVSDDGVGMDGETLRRLNERLKQKDTFIEEKKKGGIGIMNVNARLALYYKNNYQFVMDSALSVGTNVRIVIPAELLEED